MNKKVEKFLFALYCTITILGGLLLLIVFWCSLLDGTFGHLADV